jgi:hypothetical protein
LCWLKSYLSNRCQRVIIKDAISSVDLQSQLNITPRCLWGFTVWISVLLKSKVKLFCWLLALKTIISVLLGINDIADDMLGLGRLFADDTSIGHTAHDEKNGQKDGL